MSPLSAESIMKEYFWIAHCVSPSHNTSHHLLVVRDNSIWRRRFFRNMVSSSVHHRQTYRQLMLGPVRLSDCYGPTPNRAGPATSSSCQIVSCWHQLAWSSPIPMDPVTMSTCDLCHSLTRLTTINRGDETVSIISRDREVKQTRVINKQNYYWLDQD